MTPTSDCREANDRTAAPLEGKTAAHSPAQHTDSMNGTGRKTYSDRAGRAEEIARQLVAAIAEHGRAAMHDLPLESFPTSPLTDIAARTLAATDAGARGWPDVMAVAFMDAPDHVRAGFVECTQEAVFPPSAEHCRPLVDLLRAFHIERRTRELLDKAHRANESGDCIEEIKRQLLELETASTGQGIDNLLASRAFDFGAQPEKPIPLFRLAGMPLCTPGNVTNVQSAPKVGKSAVVDGMIAAVMNGDRQGPDTLSFAADNHQGFALIHFDTEQSRFDADALVRRAIRRAMLTEPPPWFYSYALADLGIYERRQALRFVMAEAARKHGGIFAVMIDGIGDLCADPNDSEEAFDLVHELHTRAINHDCAIVTVLHENPGSDKTRGHLGSQLERKAETNLRLAKDAAGVTTIWAERARHCYLPRDAGPCFAWNDESKMHLSCGTAGEMKQAANREKMLAEAEAAFGDGEFMKHSELMAAIGEAFDLKERAAKKRIQTWLAEGITRKDSAGNYHLANA